jgi:hypothetical protein
VLAERHKPTIIYENVSSTMLFTKAMDKITGVTEEQESGLPKIK